MGLSINQEKDQQIICFLIVSLGKKFWFRMNSATDRMADAVQINKMFAAWCASQLDVPFKEVESV